MMDSKLIRQIHGAAAKIIPQQQTLAALFLWRQGSRIWKNTAAAESHQGDCLGLMVFLAGAACLEWLFACSYGLPRLCPDPCLSRILSSLRTTCHSFSLAKGSLLRQGRTWKATGWMQPRSQIVLIAGLSCLLSSGLASRSNSCLQAYHLRWRPGCSASLAACQWLKHQSTVSLSAEPPLA